VKKLKPKIEDGFHKLISEKEKQKSFKPEESSFKEQRKKSKDNADNNCRKKLNVKESRDKSKK
jgi:hypothetical protein